MQSRGLLVVVSCALQHLAFLEEESPSAPNPSVLEDLVESFSFGEVKKRSLAAKFCTVLCEQEGGYLRVRNLERDATPGRPRVRSMRICSIEG